MTIDRASYEQGLADSAGRKVIVQAWAADELRMLPEAFVAAYQELWEAGLRHPAGTLGADTRGVLGVPRVKTSRTSTGQSVTRGLAKPEKRRGHSPEYVRNERWLRVRGRIDRQLRKLARQIRDELEGRGQEVSPRRCPKCRRFAESEWGYCPWDGQAYSDAEEV